MPEKSIQGVKSRRLRSNGDERGSLVALDGGQDLPFELKRVFYIYDAPYGAERGRHSVSASMLFICVCGSVSLTCDNGSERATYHLSSPDVAVHTEPGIWVELSEFAKGAVLLVLSSLSYAEARYFDLPMFNELAAVPRDGGE